MSVTEMDDTIAAVADEPMIFPYALRSDRGRRNAPAGCAKHRLSERSERRRPKRSGGWRRDLAEPAGLVARPMGNGTPEPRGHHAQERPKRHVGGLRGTRAGRCGGRRCRVRSTRRRPTRCRESRRRATRSRACGPRSPPSRTTGRSRAWLLAMRRVVLRPSLPAPHQRLHWRAAVRCRDSGARGRRRQDREGRGPDRVDRGRASSPARSRRGLAYRDRERRLRRRLVHVHDGLPRQPHPARRHERAADTGL